MTRSCGMFKVPTEPAQPLTQNKQSVVASPELASLRVSPAQEGRKGALSKRCDTAQETFFKVGMLALLLGFALNSIPASLGGVGLILNNLSIDLTAIRRWFYDDQMHEAA